MKLKIKFVDKNTGFVLKQILLLLKQFNNERNNFIKWLLDKMG